MKEEEEKEEIEKEAVVVADGKKDITLNGMTAIITMIIKMEMFLRDTWLQGSQILIMADLGTWPPSPSICSNL